MGFGLLVLTAAGPCLLLPARVAEAQHAPECAAPEARPGAIVAKVTAAQATPGGIRITLDAGLRRGLVPEARGVVLECRERKPHPRGELTVDRVWESEASVLAPGLRIDEARAMRWVVLDAPQVCTVASTAPDFSSADVREGRHPPPDHVLATIADTQAFDDGRLRVQLDLGAAGGLLPGARGYVLAGTSGLPTEVAFTIASASARDAVAILPRGASAALVARGKRVVVQRATCR